MHFCAHGMLSNVPAVLIKAKEAMLFGTEGITIRGLVEGLLMLPLRGMEKKLMLGTKYQPVLRGITNMDT